MPKEHDTIEEVKPVEEAKTPEVVNMEYDTPPKEFVPGTKVPDDKEPEDMSNTEYVQWAYDNLMPFWAIKANLKYRTPPTVTGLEPSTAAIGDPSFTLYVSGTNFHAESVIVFGGQDENTTLNEDGRLQTGVNMSYWHGGDTVKVEVRNGPGGAISEPMDFTFTAAAGQRADAISKHEPDDDDDVDDDDDGKPAKRKAKHKK